MSSHRLPLSENSSSRICAPPLLRPAHVRARPKGRPATVRPRRDQSPITMPVTTSSGTPPIRGFRLSFDRPRWSPITNTCPEGTVSGAMSSGIEKADPTTVHSRSPTRSRVHRSSSCSRTSTGPEHSTGAPIGGRPRGPHRSGSRSSVRPPRSRASRTRCHRQVLARRSPRRAAARRPRRCAESRSDRRRGAPAPSRVLGSCRSRRSRDTRWRPRRAR